VKAKLSLDFQNHYSTKEKNQAKPVGFTFAPVAG